MTPAELQSAIDTAMVRVEAMATQRAALAKIETTVMCMDIAARANRRFGQIQRRAVERIANHPEAQCAAIRRIIQETQ